MLSFTLKNVDVGGIEMHMIVMLEYNVNKNVIMGFRDKNDDQLQSCM